jgi:hypothetical protein
MTIVPYLEATCQCQPGVSTIFRYISLDSHYKDLTTLCRNVTKSQPPQSNSRNALPGSNNSGSNSSQSVITSTKKGVPASRVSGTGTSAKSRTTSVNGVAVTRSDNTGSNSKSKKPTNLKPEKKSRVIEISDPEDSDSDSLEREAALASPAKGAESRKASTKVSKKFICSRTCIKN